MDELLDLAEHSESFDVIRDLAYPLPATVIARLLGAPHEHLDLIKAWSDAIAGSFTWAPDTMRAAHRALVDLTAYMADLIDGTIGRSGVLTRPGRSPRGGRHHP